MSEGLCKMINSWATGEGIHTQSFKRHCVSQPNSSASVESFPWVSVNSVWPGASRFNTGEQRKILAKLDTEERKTMYF